MSARVRSVRRSAGGLVAGRVFLQAPGTTQPIAQQELDLGIHAAQVVPGPALESGVDPGVNANQDGLTRGHETLSGAQV